MTAQSDDPRSMLALYRDGLRVRREAPWGDSATIGWLSSTESVLAFARGDGFVCVVNFGPDPQNKYITTYFRKTFDVADASKVKSLALRLLRDDGAVLYLNGQEVVRDNMDAGTVNFDSQ